LANEKLKVTWSGNPVNAKSYCVKYKYYNSLRPLDFKESSEITVVIVDTCNPPSNYHTQPQLIKPVYQGIDYTVGTSQKVVNLAEWTTEPAYCASRIVYENNKPLIMG
jgi:hypothetical protein